MSGSIKRRDFIKTTSLLGASIAVANPVSGLPFQKESNITEIKNKYFTISFDTKKGTFSIYRSNGTHFIHGATSCANLNISKHSIASGYKHTVRSTAFSDALGSGKKLIIFSSDRNKKLDFEIQLSLYDNLEAITVEAVCKNVSKSDLIIHSIEPIRVLKNEGGMLSVPGISKCITNGAMYYNAGTIHEFGSKYQVTSDIKEVKRINNSIASPNETVNSWWNIGLFSGYDKEGLVLGYLENRSGLGQLLISKTAAGEISFLAESVYDGEIILHPGKTIGSDRFMINIAADPYRALEMYADAVGKINNARTKSIINGWCSWFYTLSQVSEQEVIRNTAFAAKHIKPFGLEYIQVDEGYQKWHGEWEGNERFPQGMKWLANKIKEHGFKAGIWISPFVISEPAELFQKHPDWLLKNLDGTIKRVGVWPEDEQPPADENPKRYCLDITHPGAAKWLYDLIDTIANDWRYEMIKIDFVAWSIFATDRYYDPTLSSAQVYRKGLEIIRKAAGDKCHILECGPGAITVGLIDSMRIEADVYYGFNEAAWETYFTHPVSSASAAAKRYYFHKRTWINDADHICMDILNSQQSEAAATLIAMSGGNLVSGDRLIQLDPYKLEILQKITPSFGEAAIPVDLFDAEMQSVFALKIKKQFAEWTVVGFFNSSLTTTVEKKFSLERLWLDTGKTYIAFDFWKKKFVGEISGEIKVTIQPGSVVLLALHEKSGKPQFISTDRHVLQGAVETESVNWNENTKTLSGISMGPLNTLHNVYVYIPEPHKWTWGGHILFHDYDSYSLRSIDENIIQVTVHFEKNKKVNWEINSEKFFK
jgi:alpha-galactosidase